MKVSQVNDDTTGRQFGTERQEHNRSMYSDIQANASRSLRALLDSYSLNVSK